MKFEDLPLREQKQARTRAALVEALLQRVATRSVAEIAVSELTAAAGVSEATFFNYFKAKEDLLTFFIQLWSVEMAALEQQIASEQVSGLGAIEALFDKTGEGIEANPSLMLEIIAHQSKMPASFVFSPLTRADRLLRLPGVEGALDLPERGLREILPSFLSRAADQGEIPRERVADLVLALSSLFFGVPLLLARIAPTAVRSAYRAQLALLWAGARHMKELP